MTQHKEMMAEQVEKRKNWIWIKNKEENEDE